MDDTVSRIFQNHTRFGIDGTAQYRDIGEEKGTPQGLCTAKGNAGTGFLSPPSRDLAGAADVLDSCGPAHLRLGYAGRIETYVLASLLLPLSVWGQVTEHLVHRVHHVWVA
jgi:hypothetical protein